MNSTTRFLTLLVVLGILQSTMLQTAAGQTAVQATFPYPDAARPKAIDRGALAQFPATPISLTIALRLPNLEEAENLLISLHTPGDPKFHHFLTADQFVTRFAPNDAEVERIIAALEKHGLAAQRITATTLKVTGLPSDIDRTFEVSMHSYEMPAQGNSMGYTFHAPLTRPTIPAEVAGSVASVAGLDSRPALHSARIHAARAHSSPAAAAAQGNPPGFWTVMDFANYYDVQPLYRRGLSGKGRTLGILTFASFTPGDAFAYWSAVGLSVNPNRLQIVDIDGGPGAPRDASDSAETTLDVEQSGGVAPGANIIVYQAPNTSQGFVDVFAAATEANSTETLSISWLTWEWFFNLENSPVIDPLTGKTTGVTQAIHELLVRAAIQGQTLFAGSGDNGAYTADEFTFCYPTNCSLPLAVGYPASDPAITAAGGTTLPGLQTGYCLNQACTPPYWSVNIPNERVWGWDYLEGWCDALGIPDPIACAIFAWGSGGGVSVAFGKPVYQLGLPGVQRSQPGQVWQASAGYGSEYGLGTYYALPAYYQGRNVPDISFNADPQTGYLLYYTSDLAGFGIQAYWGGTSFVAPQLNGVSALLGEELHSRLGLLDFPLYALAQNGHSYNGPHAPLHAIAYGNNWFYYGSNGYNLGAGLGTLDVANFSDALHDLF